jgi:precorrin-3B methylase
MTDDQLFTEARQTIHELRVNHREIQALIGIVGSQAESATKVSSMEGLLKDIRDEMREIRLEQKAYVKDTEIRVRSLEDWRTEQRGGMRVIVLVASVVASLVGAIAAWLVQHFSGGRQ